MKKLFVILLTLLLLFCLCSCGQTLHGSDTSDDNINLHPSAIFDENAENQNDILQEKDNDFIFSWMSYIELSVNAERDTEDEYRKYIDGLFKNMSAVKVNHVLVHSRAYADSFYKSDIFPPSEYICSKGEMLFDPLRIITDTAKQYGITVHAWINPYRISKSDDISSLSKDHIARKWYEQENENDVVAVDGNLYFNPCSLKVQKLIIEGARELLENYDIGGIHIDDYFYPQNCGDFDKKEYESYLSQGGKLSLEDFRRENVSSLVSSLYCVVKQYGEDKLFTISPSGDTEKAYNELYADVYLWCKEKGYADIIIPQIYFGFENEKQPFKSCLDSWLKITDTENVKLVPGLALYKAGQKDINAGTGEKEWQENSDIIKRQMEYIYSGKCSGFALYSASYINFYETFLSKEVNNIKSVIQ